MSGNGTSPPGPLELKQRFADGFEAMQTHIDRRQGAIHTGMPGKIVSYDAATMTATVQCALQAIQKMDDGTHQPVTIEPIADCPVHFPGGGGFSLTFPVKAGDDCWIKFSERSIDNWFQQGGVQQPSDWRMHDITDAVVEVGVRSQPNVPTNVSTDTTQLRSDDGKVVIDLDGANGAVKVTANDVTTGQSGGNLGVLGATPIAKGIITGSKGGNVALANLIHFLAQRGDITDETT